jgi:hypothetical protein
MTSERPATPAAPAAGEAHAGEGPAGKVPGGEVPAGEVPGGEVPGGKVPGGKLPRVDYGKYLRGGAAGRRALVDGLGDALREVGCARLQGHGSAAGALAASELGHGLLGALEGYFGLPPGALRDLAPGGAVRAGAGHEGVALLLLVPEVPAGLAVRLPGGPWVEATANPGELLAVSGEGLRRLTGGVLPAAEAHLPAGTLAWRLDAAAGAELGVRPEFARSRPAEPQRK